LNTTTRPATKKSLTEPVTPSHHSNEESNKKKSTKRKHSISPLPHTPITIKKRTKNETSIKKSHLKRQESETEEDEDDRKKSTVNKRKLNLDLSSMLKI
jgi:hypothetical protein